MALSLEEMMAQANAAVARISVAEAEELIGQGALLLDVRDAPELEAQGRASGSHHIPRGMLEFRADPKSPFHDTALRQDRPVVLHCASGGRAALAGKLLLDMGFDAVYNVGGFAAWKEAGAPVEEPVDHGMTP